MTPYDVVIVGGGPSGATAAHDLAKSGRRVLLIDREGRIKPCGGAIPPRLIRDFDIPDHMLVAKVTAARMISPSNRKVDMPIEDGFVGMVDRETFDPWLRARAEAAGAERLAATFERVSRDPDDTLRVHYTLKSGEEGSVPARALIGADGANSAVARQCIPGADRMKFVFAYHEIIDAPAAGHPDYDPTRCDVYYRSKLSPDFYGWVFPHGDRASIGTGSAIKGFALRRGVADLREAAGLADGGTIRHEGAPIPMKPLKHWDNGRDILLAGDAAGVVAPASGEGIYYAMLGGRLAAEAMQALLATGDVTSLKLARQRFMKVHGRVFWILGLLQRMFYASDKRRESFVKICADKDVQSLTWDSYMNKELVRKKPFAHVRIFFKDVAHLLGFASA